MQPRYKEWNGYRPTPIGRSQKYHVRRHNGSWAISCWIEDEEYFTRPRPNSDTDRALKGAIQVGRQAGIQPGGTLTVNEYKDVVKTAYSSWRGINRRYLVGNYETFHVVFDGPNGLMDNSDPRGLELKSPWPFQMVGTRYQYRTRPQDIVMEYGDWERKIQVSLRNAGVVFDYILDQVHEARNGKPGRFYVNEHGLMFAPGQESTDGTMQGVVYAGRIDLDNWIPHEIIEADWDEVLECGDDAA